TAGPAPRPGAPQGYADGGAAGPPGRSLPLLLARGGLGAVRLAGRERVVVPPTVTAELCERLGEQRRGGSRRHDVDPQPELLRSLGRLRADDGDDRRGVRLARDADEVAHGR